EICAGGWSMPEDPFLRPPAGLHRSRDATTQRQKHPNPSQMGRQLQTQCRSVVRSTNESARTVPGYFDEKLNSSALEHTYTSHQGTAEYVHITLALNRRLKNSRSFVEKWCAGTHEGYCAAHLDDEIIGLLLRFLNDAA